GYRPKVVTWTDVRQLSKPGLLGALIVLAPVRSVPIEFLRDAFRLLQFAGPGLRQAGKQHGSAFLTVSRLDGAFGLVGLSEERDPVSGGLAGLAKTASHEWPEVSCKALDLPATWQDVE